MPRWKDWFAHFGLAPLPRPIGVYSLSGLALEAGRLFAWLGCLGGQSICLGDTTSASAAWYGRRINAFFVKNLACRRQGDPGGRGCGLDRCRRGFGRCFLGRRFGSRGRLGLGVDAGDEFIGHDAITVALDDFHQHAIGR